MRILYLLSDYPKLSEKFVSDEIDAVRRQGHSVHIVAMRDPEEEITHVDGGCYSVRYFSDLGKRGVLALVKEKNIQHIHCHFAYSHVDIAYKIHRKIGIPFSFTVHAFDLYAEVHPNLIDWCSAAKCVLTISKHNKYYMVDSLGIDACKIHVIPCGIFLDRFEPRDYSHSPLRIISACRLVEKKGIANLILAMKQLKNRGVQFSCEIAGDGPLRQSLQGLIDQSELSSEVRLIGPKSHPDMTDFIRSGSVFALPCIESRDGNRDGIPVVLMEAMALRIPVISTNLSGIPELIDNRHNGLLVAPGNISELADCLIELMSDEALAEHLRGNSREKIEKEHSVKKNVEELMELLEKADTTDRGFQNPEPGPRLSPLKRFFKRVSLGHLASLKFFLRFLRVRTALRPFQVPKRMGSRFLLPFQSVIDGLRIAKEFEHIHFCETDELNPLHTYIEGICQKEGLCNVFNPSFYIDDKLKLVAFRAISRRGRSLNSYLSISEGPEKGRIVNLSTTYSASLGCEQLIDPKIFRLGEEFFITFNSAYVEGGNDLFIMKIYPEKESPKKVTYQNRSEQERNWAFFSRDGEVYALYWLNPLKILRLKSMTQSTWDFEEYFCGQGSSFEGLTLGTQLAEWEGRYYFVAHKKYRAKRKKLYLGKACRLDFDSRSIKCDAKWLSHSEQSLYGDDTKHNDKLFSCSYFSGIQVNDDGVMISYGINDVGYGFSRYSVKQFVESELTEIFSSVYKNKLWGSRNLSAFFSGGGSNDDNTTEYRQYLQRFIELNDIQRVVDLGCGDFRLGRLMDWSGKRYLGLDVVGPLIQKNNDLYSNQNISFLERDAVVESLPSADLCLVRQVLQHLSNEDILAILPKLNQYRFVLITDGLPPVTPAIRNVNKPTDHNNRFDELYASGLYLESPPFNLKAKVVLSYPSRNRKEIFRTILIEKGS